MKTRDDKKLTDDFNDSDTFIGAYAVEFVKQKRGHQEAGGVWDIKKAVEFACKASARTIESYGPQESIPWADEVYR